MNPSPTRPVGRPRLYSDAAIFIGIGRVLVERGGVGLTIAALGQVIGSSGPALLKRFGSKQRLLLAYVAWAMPAVQTRCQALHRSESSPLAVLRAALLHPPAPNTDAALDSVGLLHLVALLRDPERDRALDTALLQWYARYRDEIRRLLEAAVAAGDLVMLEPDRVARLLLEALVGAAVRWDDPGHQAGVGQRLGEVMAEILAPYQA